MPTSLERCCREKLSNSFSPCWILSFTLKIGDMIKYVFRVVCTISSTANIYTRGSISFRRPLIVNPRHIQWDLILHWRKVKEAQPPLTDAGRPLTHLPLHKMAAILADDIFNCIFLNENDRIPIHISVKYVPRSPVVNKPVLIQVMDWRRTGDKPLPGPVMTQFIDAYMRYKGEMS